MIFRTHLLFLPSTVPHSPSTLTQCSNAAHKARVQLGAASALADALGEQRELRRVLRLLLPELVDDAEQPRVLRLRVGDRLLQHLRLRRRLERAARRLHERDGELVRVRVRVRVRVSVRVRVRVKVKVRVRVRVRARVRVRVKVRVRG